VGVPKQKALFVFGALFDVVYLLLFRYHTLVVVVVTAVVINSRQILPRLNRYHHHVNRIHQRIFRKPESVIKIHRELFDGGPFNTNWLFPEHKFRKLNKAAASSPS